MRKKVLQNPEVSRPNLGNELHEFYIRGGSNSVAKRWAEAADVGSKVTPSVYNSEYREFIKSVIKNCVLKDSSCSIVSIGSGVAKVETELATEGYQNIICTDIFDEFVEVASQGGLRAERISALQLNELSERFDLVYLDGSLGHLSSTFDPPFEYAFLEFFESLQVCLKPGGQILTSDDRPYTESEIEVHRSMPHLRVSDGFLKRELDRAGYEIVSVGTFEFHRPGVGRVSRRIVVAKPNDSSNS